MAELGRIDMRDITIQSGLKSLDKKQEPLQGEKISSFAEILKNSVNDVNEVQKNADLKVREFISGENTNLHETMISLEKADISFRLMMQVRNKILDAYKEVMNMNI